MSPGVPLTRPSAPLDLLCSGPTYAEHLLVDAQALPQALTATHLKHSRGAVPDSLTVIDNALMDLVNILPRSPASSALNQCPTAAQRGKADWISARLGP